jgi:NAD+ synthase (glutamine-hydrolysing)
MRIALAQLDPTVGDVEGNIAAIEDAYRDAVGSGADLVVTGELSVTGYPPDDLLLKPAFITAVAEQLEALAARVGSTPLLVGFPEDVSDLDTPTGIVGEDAIAQGLANSAAMLVDGLVARVYRKQRIPNYGVFDEARYFRAGSDVVVVDVGDVRVGLTVCEDLWGPGGPATDSARAGAQLIISPNASPFHTGKRAERERWARRHAADGGAWIAYVNLVGGQDDVVYDGDSFVMAPDGTVIARAAQFVEDVLVVDIDPTTDAARPGGIPTQLTEPAAVYEALVLGTRDYLRKNGFGQAVIGLSGGIDSALTATVAADALGPDRVLTVAMPSPYSSPGSITDAKELAGNLGTTWLELRIDDVMDAFATALAEPFAGTEEGVAEENIQSRIRGTLLMALSNKHGHLLLATGNKSEYAVGYATLYGDMAGGFAPLKDVYKTVVYDVSRYRNGAHRHTWAGPPPPPLPEAILDKPPSAELRPDQLDTDSLPDYDDLDAILAGYIERYAGNERLVAEGHDPELVTRVTRMVDHAEYKRRQAPPGVKVTTRAFGRERRLPITHAWHG